MSFRFKGRSLVIEILLTAVLAASGALPAFATETHQFDVPSEDAPSAIREFAAQAQVQILVAGENVTDKRLHAVSGELSTEQGLRLLLADSGLAAQYVGDRSIALVMANSNSSPQAIGDPTADNKEGKKSFWDRLQLAQANQGTAQRSSAVVSNTQSTSGNSENSSSLDEIIVTAQKKSERLQDVPVPVAVIDTANLTENNQTLLKDYVTSVPGITLQADIVGQQELSIRGITQGGSGTPTVGVTVDDVPYGGSTSASGAGYLPDFDPGDLARIEVLRGPQGTLYGSNSMGGVVKFVTVDPSTDGFSGRVSAGTSSVYNGGQDGYNFRASANIPLSDTLAVRVSGYRRQDPGYIDNPILHIDGINESEADGGRIAALWKPSDTMSLKLGAMYQYIHWDGASDVDVAPGLGPWDQNYIAGMGGYDRAVQLYSAVFNAKLGPVDFVSITGYNQGHTHSTLDFGYAFGPTLLKDYGATGVPYNGFVDPSKFSQEMRFSGSIFSNFDWRVGGFYTHEHDSVLLTIFATNAITGQLINPYFSNHYFPTYDEYAGFGDLTYRVTDQFDIQIGGRESFYKNANGLTVESGAFFGSTPVVIPNTSLTANNFTYLLTPEYKLSPDLMVYARLASGYRPGSGESHPPPNALCVINQVPCQVNADKTETYELGTKGDFLDHRISVDASLYYIDWKDMQLVLISPRNSFQYSANGGASKSEGVELSVFARPVRDLTVGAWVDYDNAVLTEAFPATSTVSGAVGDRLPIDPRFSGHLSLDEEFPLPINATGFVGGEVSYVGYREGSFTAAPTPRQALPAYTKTDLHAGFKSSVWTANLYVNNLANIRGLVGGGMGYDPPNAFVYITPRTVGVTLTREF